jgi:hypothetical protein
VGFTIRLHREQSGAGLDSAWLQGFSVERYRPLTRLLDESEFRFLSSLPGYDPAAGRRLRAARAQAFAAYLERLRVDFFRLEAFGRALIAAGAASPDLAGGLFRQRLAFLRGYCGIRVRLQFFRWGLTGVDAQAVLEPLRNLTLSIQPSAA